MRTDSFPLRDFSLTQLELAGYDLKWKSDDVRKLFPDEPLSAYEQKLTAQGNTVYGFEAVPGSLPEQIIQTAPLSLVSYLPENVEDLEYIPHGMQGCVTVVLIVEKRDYPNGLAPLFSNGNKSSLTSKQIQIDSIIL